MTFQKNKDSYLLPSSSSMTRRSNLTIDMVFEFSLGCILLEVELELDIVVQKIQDPTKKTSRNQAIISHIRAGCNAVLGS